MTDKLLGKIIEEDDYQNSIFNAHYSFSHPLSQRLFDAIRKHQPMKLSELFIFTKDREIIAYAMELANEYAKQKMKQRN